jgi:transposase
LKVAIGIDSHKGSLAAAAVDELGRVVGVTEVANDQLGHRELLRWRATLQGEIRIGIECSGSYGNSAARVLVGAGEDVYEVPSNLSHGKPGVRTAASPTPSTRSPSHGSWPGKMRCPGPAINQRFEDLKLLSDHHDHLKRLRTQLTNRIHKQLMIAHPGYHRSLGSMFTEKAKRSILMMLRRDDSVRAKLTKRNVRELRRLDAEMKELKAEIRRAVAATGTSLTSQCGIGSVIAARVLGEVGDVSNLRSKAGFARLTGTAPIPASSGKTVRHRLNRGGNRKLNHALYFVAVTRCQLDDETKVFLERKMAEGKTKKEAIRCLKRHLANLVYRTWSPTAIGSRRWLDNIEVTSLWVSVTECNGESQRPF